MGAGVTLFVRYCATHCHAWPIADPWRPGDPCPAWREAMGATASGGACNVKAVDAIATINGFADGLDGPKGS